MQLGSTSVLMYLLFNRGMSRKLLNNLGEEGLASLLVTSSLQLSEESLNEAVVSLEQINSVHDNEESWQLECRAKLSGLFYVQAKYIHDCIWTVATTPRLAMVSNFAQQSKMYETTHPQNSLLLLAINQS